MLSTPFVRALWVSKLLAVGFLVAPVFIVESAEAQEQGTITGLVVDAQSQQPVSTVQVFIPTIGLGVLSGSEGTYLLQNVTAGTHTILAQRLGYGEQSVTITVVSGQSLVLDFEMTRVSLALDQIVVTGTPGGTQRRAIGNVVSRLDMEAVIEAAPIMSLEQALGGRISGVNIMPSVGQVGGDGAPIRIRGSSSTALSNDPIVYVDGVRINMERRSERGFSVSRLNDINPADIETIEVIKGPAAATLYGTEASNGVIQIITKKGATGAARFDASLGLGAVWMPNPAKKVGETYGISPVSGELISHNLYLAEKARGIDLFQYGPSLTPSLSVQGGTGAFNYYGSINHSYREGIDKWNFDKKTSARLSLQLVPREDLSINLSTNYVKGETRTAVQWIWFTWGNPVTSLDAGGADDRRRGYFVRPIEVFDPNVQDDVEAINRVGLSVEVLHTPWSWLRNRVVLGTDRSFITRNDLIFRDPDGIGGQFLGTAGREGRKEVFDNTALYNSLDAASTVSFRLSDERLGSATSFGLQYYHRENHSRFARGDGFATRPLTTVSAAALTTGGEDFIENATVGAYVQQQFDWNERIFLTAAVRGDDNSAFGADYDAAIYPKFSATWVMHEEAFWNISWVEQFRLRGAWGEAGQQPDVFAAARLYRPVTGPGDAPILTPSAFGNPDLAPERGQELELGFDAAFWQSRIQLQVTGYWRSTKDALVTRPVALSTAFPGFQLVNIGKIRNWGSETDLNVEVLTRDPVRWNLGLQFSTMGSEVDDLGGLPQLAVRRNRLHREGYPLASIFEYEILSADFVQGNSGAVTNLICDGGTGPDGFLRGGPPVPCDEAPRLFLGQAEPKWQAVVSSTLTLRRNWQLYVSVDGQGGHKTSSDGYNSRQTTQRNTLASNLQDDPIYMGHRLLRRNRISISGAGFVKLREVSLGYMFPDQWAQRFFGASRASATLGVRNVATLWVAQRFTDFGGIRVEDPELNLPFEGFLGEPSGQTPPLSQAVFTIRATF
jgi:TonB-linked SusC/RagA family outer membrane protein